MIAFLEGVVREVRESSVVVQAGGLGVEAWAPAATLAQCRVGEPATLHTHLTVRDETPVLYGFHHRDLLLLFRRLLDVGGVGPKLALAILSALPPALIASAVVEQDPGLLTGAPGVGRRTAERIVLELKDRIPEELLAGPGGTGKPRKLLTGAGEDAAEALVSLGYRESQVKAAVAELLAERPDDSAEALIRRALARLR
ncbi:MAG: Holliday junction branch migration protein RuvA [Deinococcales bacterium]